MGYSLSDKLWNYLQVYKKKHQAKDNGFGFGLTDLNGISRTMSVRYNKNDVDNLGDTHQKKVGRAIRYNLYFMPQKRISTSIPIGKQVA